MQNVALGKFFVAVLVYNGFFAVFYGKHESVARPENIAHGFAYNESVGRYGYVAVESLQGFARVEAFNLLVDNFVGHRVRAENFGYEIRKNGYY